MKRSFDVIVALVALALFAIPILLIIPIVRMSMGAPVFFRQIRPGFQGVPFDLIKFRTMKSTREDGHVLSDAERMTGVGKFLRASSLDELPGLWNVLKGDMSLVGPRPLLVEYLALYNQEQARRHEVRPGITGWAQVNGRNAISWEKKFELDVWYIDNRSFWLDFKILWMTVIKVLSARALAMGAM